MLIHLVVDDKFIDAARRLFDAAAPQGNRYVLLEEEIGSRIPAYLTAFQPERLSLDEFGRLVQSERRGVEGLVVHYMTPVSQAAVARMPPGIPVAWVGWGADYYHLIRSPESLLRQRTRELVRELSAARERARPGDHGPLRPILAPLRWASAVLRRRRALAAERAALSRVDYFAPVIAEDAALLMSRNAWFRPAPLTWNYPLEDSVFDGIDREGGVAGQDVLLGNSASPTNNHLDAFSLLDPLVEGTGRRIICPLSYGDPEYGDAIAAEGHRRYGDRFVALRRFMSPVEYWQTVRSCSTIVMPHLRQQAVGNVVMMMYAGASVYLDRENPAFGFFSRVELPVRALEQLPLETRAATPSAPPDPVAIRARVRQHFGFEAMLRRTRDLVGTLRSKADPARPRASRRA